MSQKLRIIRPRNRQAKGIIIDKRSIGTIWVEGRPYTYNEDKLVTNKIEFDNAVNGVDTQKAKRKIYIYRR